MLFVQRHGLPEAVLPVGHVLLSTQPQVGEVVEHEAEDSFTVGRVLRGVEDVVVPHRVDVLRRHDALARVHHAQLQESTVLDDELVGLLDGHARLTRLRVNELERDRLEIELVDEEELTLHLGGCRDHGGPPDIGNDLGLRPGRLYN